MKTLLIIILTIIGTVYFINRTDGVSVSYSENGDKIVKVECYYDEQCIQKIGNECKDIGYKIINRNYGSITAVCGGNLSVLQLLKVKFVKIMTMF